MSCQSVPELSYSDLTDLQLSSPTPAGPIRYRLYIPCRSGPFPTLLLVSDRPISIRLLNSVPAATLHPDKLIRDEPARFDPCLFFADHSCLTLVSPHPTSQPDPGLLGSVHS